MADQTEREALFKVLVSQEDDDAVIRRNGDFLCRLPASELAELSDVILEGLCGPAPVSSQPSAPALPVEAIEAGIFAIRNELGLANMVLHECGDDESGGVAAAISQHESNIEFLRALLPTQTEQVK